MSNRNVSDDVVHRRLVTREADFLLQHSVKKCTTLYLDYLESIMKTEDSKDTKDIDQAYEQLMSELSQYEFTMDKDLKVLKRCDQEIEYYKEESDKIKKQITETEQHIRELRVQLEQSQRERLFKHDYESLAEKINQYPPRHELQQQYDEALAQLNQVQGEKERVEKSLEERKTQFSLFMSSIVELRQLLQPQADSSGEVVGEVGSADSAGGTGGANEETASAALPANEEDVKME
eukprot:gb/GECG01016072.1/.p1 GENE.gb/GECG01016072.1/~~gb/GECG01016072.1/.p1  ORF type:complete len:235 (+),score=48.53 gb/GECG01016072.1/:1-705(+)